jgi:perosamine synthetase
MRGSNRQKNIPFSKPSFSEEDLLEISNRIIDVLKSGWLTSGPVVKEFEKNFAIYLNSKYTIAVSSGTAALHTTLLALGIGNKDEVILPADTYIATANTVLYVGAKPVFSDSDPLTFNISPEDIKEKITKKTKAIIVVHLGGNPCEMKEINKIAIDSNLFVIEDAAHAIGSKYKGIYCSTLGAAGTFSFYPNKIITTAEGGLVCTNLEWLSNKINIIRNQGRNKYGPSEVKELGFTYRLSDIHAAIGLTQLKYVDKFVENRNMLAKIYNNELKKLSWIIPQHIEENNLSSYYAYIIKLKKDAPIKRDILVKELHKNGIETSILFQPVHTLEMYLKLFRFKKGSFPVAEELGEFSLALPMFNEMSVNDVKYVVNQINEIVEKR